MSFHSVYIALKPSRQPHGYTCVLNTSALNSICLYYSTLFKTGGSVRNRTPYSKYAWSTAKPTPHCRQHCLAPTIKQEIVVGAVGFEPTQANANSFTDCPSSLTLAIRLLKIPSWNRTTYNLFGEISHHHSASSGI